MGKLMTDETGQDILTQLKIITKKQIDVTGYADLHNIASSGIASEYLNIGDQVIVPWSDGTTSYDEVPLDVVNFGNIETEDGETKPAIFLQWHYTLPFATVFDPAEAVLATETECDPNLFYYVKKTDGSFALQTDLENQDPAASGWYHNAIKDTTGSILQYGYNNWEHSPLRRYLNSTASAGKWWEADHVGSVEPTGYSGKQGFMAGFDKAFLKILGKPKMVTAKNYITDGGSSTAPELSETYDTFFLPSLEQHFVKPQVSGVEGNFWEYWKQASGSSEPLAQYSTYPQWIIYALNSKTSPQGVWMRSAGRGSSRYVWYVYSSGGVSTGGACHGVRCAPACAIV